ncbi:energy-dependent translational throttle protein EttA [Pseudoalteromonas sp. SR44-5]|jgi:sulfate-transporting ATPase|uniref:Energy-dependent translational throttle protein EttA n=1 Tax=Pseudoalteromonas neustonica TaxID=1840331 RepID=A0ABY3F9D5_9GAMM|nr:MULTISPECIES: energy-dependent translational throttle protein EttA [Pseudoalteromonas]MBB1294035.1 energy-dependent translational throttle protein EttA [Pseudoalteromonas sp. SR41-4]MBB1301433.1 energy-dependent translational throttle protein EttA [Pseudoalteromonas sp. SR44-8]MBB1311452.1 energy-dependent translational throttle protein EttA [Pseudoalteromonas sp. SR41-8]MBB1335715.1 energy-dependent translational throttle protein EttA [Pseudoalteromonas sp. SR41-6]MBB1344028.1 energy-depen|tara:strand:+ start:6061 stop:7734 length:1674 start_codon:yes stop_codon:yes gene_type:complete
MVLPDKFIFSMSRVSKVVPPKRTILKDISLHFFPGAKIGVLGLNGSGKSTLLRIMAGLDQEFEGEAYPQPGTKIGYLPQEPILDESKTVRETVEEAVSEVKNALNRLDEVYNEYAMEDADFDALAKEQGELEAIIQAHDGHNIDNVLERAADALRLPEWDAKIEFLSGGERRRVAICRLLLEKPDMLILDEPTNHLDAESVAWLERFLHDYEGTVVAVTHDRYFLDNVAGWILELDRGEGIPWEGNYSSWLEQKDARLQQEQKSEKARQKSIAQELEWVRSNQKGRQAKSKARMSQFTEMQQSDYQKRNETNELFIPPGPRLGDQVIEVKNLKKSFGDRVLIDDLSFTVPKGAIVGIIGANGAGKSTLFKMLSGEDKQDSGEINLGETVELATVDQFRGNMDDSNTVFQEISNGQDVLKIGNFEFQSRAYVSRFNFKGNDQQKFVKDLSGGERNRLHLAKLLKAGGNVILLDEPTNDLDVETLRALENAILEFPGCVMCISHDRWFLDRIATHILDYRDEGQINFFDGNYTEYEEWLKKTLGTAATQPKRIKYKKIG